MRKIKLRDIGRQLHADLLGKDSYRGVSLTYSWLANQWGHFSLGFIPTYLLYHFLSARCEFQRPVIPAMLYIGLAWTIFEIYNFLMPILFKKTSKSNLFYLADKKIRFKPPWKHVAYDTLTDLSFFWLGILCAGLHIDYSSNLGWITLILGVLMVYPAYHWYTTKIYLQNANYPIQRRLSQWVGHIDEKSKSIIQTFVNHPCHGKHILIYGNDISNMSKLSIGILTEKSNKLKTCCYTTAVKLFQSFEEFEEEIPLEKLWNWKNAEYLTIDDINPPSEEFESLISPKNFLATMVKHDERIDDVLRNKNIIWVIGPNFNPMERLNSWKGMLLKIGVKPDNIFTIEIPKEMKV